MITILYNLYNKLIDCLSIIIYKHNIFSDYIEFFKIILSKYYYSIIINLLIKYTGNIIYNISINIKKRKIIINIDNF